MALQDKYANADLVNGKLAVAAFVNHAKKFGAIAIEEIDAADDANSVYRMFKALDPELVLSDLRFSCDAFGAGGLISIGLYESDLGDEIDDDCFANDIDVSAALANSNGLVTVDLADRQKRLWEIAGHTVTTKKRSYDIGVKITVKGATGAGSVVLDADFLQS